MIACACDVHDTNKIHLQRRSIGFHVMNIDMLSALPLRCYHPNLSSDWLVTQTCGPHINVCFKSICVDITATKKVSPYYLVFAVCSVVVNWYWRRVNVRVANMFKRHRLTCKLPRTLVEAPIVPASCRDMHMCECTHVRTRICMYVCV